MPAGLDGNPDPIVTPARSDVIAQVAAAAMARRSADRPLMIAIDGIDGSGKSTFADELAKHLEASTGVTVIRSTVDSFHNPRAARMQRGATSPVGFYLDSHDLPALHSKMLGPFRSGSGSYIAAVFDEPSDSTVHVEASEVQVDHVLVFDGIFVQRPELADYWDYVVFLDAHERVNLSRLQHVLDDLPADPIEVVAHVLEWQRRIDRYASGMRYYLDLVAPQDQADIVIDNNRLASPRIVRPDEDG